MSNYPYNVRITVAGVDFTGPGFETERHAKVVCQNVQGQENIQRAEVIEQ